MRYLVATMVISVVFVDSAGAQPCASVECDLRMLNVDLATLQKEARCIAKLRRQAGDAKASPGRRVAAMRKLAERLSSVSHRARRARELGGLDARASAAFKKIAGHRPGANDGVAVAKSCLSLARRTYAWGGDALRCRQLAAGMVTPRRLADEMAFPHLPEKFFANSDGDVAARLFREARKKSGKGNATARLELAAMQATVGDCPAALRSLAPLPRKSYVEKLAWAEALACSGRRSEAESQLLGLIRANPARPEAVLDLAVLLDATPPTPARLRRRLSASQHYLCLTKDKVSDQREAVQGYGEAAADELGFGFERPLVALELMPSYNVDQENHRPLASCAAARKTLLKKSLAVKPTPAPSCGSLAGVLHGYDDRGPTRFRIVRDRAVRVPDRCPDPVANNAPLDDDIEGLFALGDIDGDGKPNTAVVTTYGDGQYVLGREVRIMAGKRVLAVLRDEQMRFGTTVAAAGDVNGDRRPDLLVTRPSACDCCDCSGETDELLLYLGAENHKFRRAATIAGPDGLQNWIRAVGVGDVDGDGKADVAMAHGNEIRLLRGRAKGIDRVGVLVHTRTTNMDGLAIGRTGGKKARTWWWLDSDAGEAFIVRWRAAKPAVGRLRLEGAKP